VTIYKLYFVKSASSKISINVLEIDNPSKHYDFYKINYSVYVNEIEINYFCLEIYRLK